MAVAIVAFMLLPFGDAIGKYLVTQGVPVLQVTWGRWFFHTILLTPLVLFRYRQTAFRVSNPLVQFFRAAALAMATVFFFGSLRHIPLANATAVLFVAPLIVVALSVLFLGEKVGARRWGGVIVGLAGVLLIVRPGTGEGEGLGAVLQLGSAMALGAAVCVSLYMVLTRRAAGHAPPLVAMWWMGLVGMVLTGFFAVPGWQGPTLDQWGLMAAIGLVMVIGHALVFWAADRIEASALAVTPYVEMVTSTMLGYLVFGDFPEVLTWIGCAIVVAAGLFVAWREQVASSKQG